MASPYLYFGGRRLSTAELSAARLDGHVVELGDGYIPADAVETAALRAASLGELLGDRLAATHLSAAWVHGAIAEPPARHTAQRAVGHRIHHVIDRRIAYRDQQVDPLDLAVIGGIPVTTPERTVCDLLRVGDAEHVAAARALVDLRPDGARAAFAWLVAHPGLPGSRTARARLRLWGADQEDETR